MRKEKSSKKREHTMNNKRNHDKAHSNYFQNDTSEEMGSRMVKHKQSRKNLGVTSDDFSIKLHKRMIVGNSELHNQSIKGHATPLRKMVDPETAKYFLEIANLFENNGVDMDVRPTVCGNALEETRGKEFELATDMIISRTLQCLLEGCDLEQLCSFLINSAKDFPSMAVDKFGSHVAETALKSLAVHLQEGQSYSLVEETFHKICQEVGADSISVMCNRYGSHVLRSLLCLCMGVPLGTLDEFHITKPSSVFVERLNCMPDQLGGNICRNVQNSFPDTFKFLVREILSSAKDEISTLRTEKYSSFVLQCLLKLSVEDEQLLLHMIMILLGCQEEDVLEQNFSDATKQKIKVEVLGLLEDTASSHLLEVIIEVAPMALYNELLDVIFKGPLLEISSHKCGNFVVQAMISSARTREHVHIVWEELRQYISRLFEAGKSGVVASILSACQRLQTCVNEFCQTLSVAACSESEFPSCIVPHLLHLDNYFRHKSHWKWPSGDKMHVLGCFMLQNIFKIANATVKPYIESITSMEADYILETAKDAGGGRVLEAFLCSDALTKQKLEVLTKLQGYFGELSMHPSGSFIVEKCFTASNMAMRETITAEVLNVQPELFRTKHGPYLLRKLDIEGYVRNPKEWKTRQESRAAAYQDYAATFGDKSKAFSLTAHEPSQKASEKKTKKQQEKIAGHSNFSRENPSTPLPSPLPCKRQSSSHSNAVKFVSVKSFTRNSMRAKRAFKSKKRESSPASELVSLARKSKLSQDDVHKLFDPKTIGDKSHVGMPFMKKHNKS